MATAAALSKIERAHQMYRDGRHGDALGLYTEALAAAKTKAQKIALHSNRAACYLKLHDFKKSLAPIPECEEESTCLENEDGNPLAEEDRKNGAPSTDPQSSVDRSGTHAKGWEAIPKPKGHSGLDYSRWDCVEDGSSEDEDEDEEEQQPRYRFRVRTVK